MLPGCPPARRHREPPVLVDLGGDECRRAALHRSWRWRNRRTGRRRPPPTPATALCFSTRPLSLGFHGLDRAGGAIDRGQVAPGRPGAARRPGRQQAAGGVLERLHDQRRRVPRVEPAGGHRQRRDAVAIAAGDALEVAADVEPLAVGGQRGERRHVGRARRVGRALGERRRLPGRVHRAGGQRQRGRLGPPPGRSPCSRPGTPACRPPRDRPASARPGWSSRRAWPAW